MTKQDLGSMNKQYISLAALANSGPANSGGANHTDSLPATVRKRPQATLETVEAMVRAGSQSKLKAAMRASEWPMGHPIRAKLWKVLIMGPDSTGDNLFEEYAKKLFENEEDEDLPINIASELRVHNLLSPQGIQATQRVLYVIGETLPHIKEFSPLLYAVAATLAHYMTEKECFDAIYHLIKSRTQYFLSPSSSQLKASAYVIKDLAYIHCKSAAAGLARLCQDGDLTALCDEWVLWIFKYLPFDYLVSVLDCYFIEGSKVLYRVALTLLALYHKSCDMGDYTKPEVGIQRFCETIEESVSVEKLLKTAFGIRGFTRREIGNLFAKNESRLKNQGKGVGNGSSGLTMSSSMPSAHPPSITRQISSSLLPSFQRSRGGQHPRKKLDKMMSSQSFVLDQKFHHNFTLEGVVSAILDHHQLQQLWSHLPPLQGVQEPEKVFTTTADGYSISRFYEHCEGMGPTLIIIKTLVGDVLGAYCSTDWNERRHNVDMGGNVSFFGTGESFVFKMVPDPYVYNWVGRTNPNCIATCSMFMAADKSFLIIGGGGGEAIYIDETLDHGRSASCTTFNNTVLVDSSDGSFQVQAMEVFAFK